MKKLFYIITFISMSCFSQSNLETTANLVDIGVGTGTSGNLGFWIPGSRVDTSVEGSVYLFPSWQGLFKIVSKDGVVSKIYNLNYNLKNNTLETEFSKDSVFQYDSKNISYILNSNKKYKFIKDGDLNGLYFEIYDGSKIKLFKEFKISILKGVVNPLTQVKDSKDKYVQSFNYFIFKENQYKKINPSKGTVLKLLEDKKDLVKKYVADNKLSYESDENLNKILMYYESL
jgi:hypothetical protein